MTKDEALKLALEALEEYVNVVVSVNDPNEWAPKVADAGEPARKAITAIKDALENNT
jgi:predicted RNase H-like HicB family nuclease